jgi:hypothetical protein
MSKKQKSSEDCGCGSDKNASLYIGLSTPEKRDMKFLQHVKDTLIDELEYSPIQAEQILRFITLRPDCILYHGDMSEAKRLQSILSENKIPNFIKV